MQIPPLLKIAIEQELSTTNKKAIVSARADLSERYRHAKKAESFMAHADHRASYIATRMPATFAAVSAALTQLKTAAPDLHITSMLDLGAGPGTGMWAATEIFSELKSITQIENDKDLIAISRRLAENNVSLKGARWEQLDLESQHTFSAHDLVLFGYSFGEINNMQVLDSALTAASQAILIVEPGTPAGFERIRLIRDHVIAKGFRLAAPCPHAQNCPMTGTDWCHFYARVPRSALHRRAKEGELGYEDEKFSYIAAIRDVPNMATARILRHPQKRPGHINFSLCTQKGIVNKTVSKKDKDIYKTARKLEWGDDLGV